MKLFDFAMCSQWDARLQTLADLAEKERWHYRKLPSQRALPVLHDYTRFTFQRCFEQNKVAQTDEVSCFNTGLLTPNHEQVFGYFRRITETRVDGFDGQWFLHSWAPESSHHLGDFTVLPPLATYWENADDIVFKPGLEVSPQVDHIIVENLERFPAAFGGSVGDDGVPFSLQSHQDDEDDEDSDLGSETAGGADREIPEEVLFTLRNLLDGAISRTVRLCKRSYRVAVPQFYSGRIQLLLPLFLRGATDVDLALTLERVGDRYRAATVLLPDWAYTHARLLSRPNSEWLGGFLGEQ
jgi:hypothetical protein